MNRAFPTILLAVAASFATVPVAFTSGTPAKADDVNKNFAALDSAIQKKADAAAVSVLQSAVSTKADQTKIDDLTKTVASKKDSAWIVTTINGKLPTGALVAKNNLSELKDSAAKTRQNLGLGRLATKDSLTSADVGALRKSSDTATRLTVVDKFGTTTLTGAGLTIDRSLSYLATALPGQVLRTQTNKVEFYNQTNDTVLGTISNGGAMFGAFNYNLNGPRLAVSDGNYGLTGAAGNLHLYTVYGNVFVHKKLSDGTFDQPTTPLASQDWAASNFLALSGGNVSGDIRVSGRISATPTIPVADYVFEPDYKLAPLSEVEAYTKEHKHLPEVPSATEIEQGGLDLAKMNLLLLKKVEELTLHTIELEKRMKAFEAAQKP